MLDRVHEMRFVVTAEDFDEALRSRLDAPGGLQLTLFSDLAG
jgi:hypothetical protein